MDDPEVQTLLKAAASFDRMSYGFSPIPSAADVRLETRPTSQYDAMLHITAKTSRTIAFRKENGKYVWIGEQESFQGPRKYKTVGLDNHARARRCSPLGRGCYTAGSASQFTSHRIPNGSRTTP